MIPSVEYATLFQYSPRGHSEMAIRSRNLKDAIKGGNIEILRNLIFRVISEKKDAISNFLHKNVTLIPVPRSSPLRPSSLWPSLEIANLLAALQLGIVAPCLKRRYRINPSSLFSDAEQRPSIAEQYDSLEVEDCTTTQNITLVDDIITIGRTCIAAASRISEKFPNANIRIFTLLQTKGLELDLDSYVNFQVNSITYNASSCKCTRHQ